jgi:hypothetical protein
VRVNWLPPATAREPDALVLDCWYDAPSSLIKGGGMMAASSRRLVFVAVVAVLVAAGIILLRSSSGKKESVTRESATPRQVQLPGSTPIRPIFQQPVITLTPSTGNAIRTEHANGAFEGRVVSALTRKGLPHAQLTFARGEEVTSVSSASDGTFWFEPRTSGRWALAAATADAHLPFAPEWGQSPVLLDALPGEVVRGITVALVPAEELEGRVIDPQDKPVAGAEVTVLGGGAGATTLVPLKDRFRSGPDGTFRFTAPEDAIVEAQHEGFATARARVDYSVRVSRKLTVRLKPAGGTRLAIDGVVEDQRGSPADGAVISAAAKARVGEPPATVRTDAEGRFQLRDLEGGTWLLTASKPGAAPASVEAAAGATGVRIRLTAGAGIAGHVRDRRSKAPIAPFTVLVQSNEVRSISVIDLAGRYEFDDLAPGDVVVSVVAPGYAPSPEVRVTIPAPGAPPARADFDLSPGGTLQGVVVERGSSLPIADARVEVEGTSPSLGVPVRNETTTDQEGRFTLNGLAESTIGISASAPGHHARIISAPPIPEGETRGPVTIELTPVKPGEDPRVELAGIGAMLEKAGDLFRITMVVPNSGAAEVGLTPGDEVLSINGSSVKPMTFADAVPLLRGPEGTTVTLVVVKSGAAQQVVVTVPRRLIRG